MVDTGREEESIIFTELRIDRTDRKCVDLPGFFDRGNAESGKEFLTHLHGLFDRLRGDHIVLNERTFDDARIDDGFLIKTDAGLGCQVRKDRTAAGRLTGDGDVLRVTAEVCDILHDPLDTGLLVEGSKVRRSIWCLF